MLVILAGITLNAVIGEDGIIFQAKDTKNMITNETEYDNQQLAALQNELRDNELYTGIGIIPGTDTGGSSEGGKMDLAEATKVEVAIKEVRTPGEPIRIPEEAMEA